MTTKIDVDTLIQRLAECLAREDGELIATIANQVLPFRVKFDEDNDVFLVSNDR